VLLLLVLPMTRREEQDRPSADAVEPKTAQAPARDRPEAKDGGQPKEVPVPDLTGRAEQLGAIIVKTLDLAEAGLSLGITVLTRAGAAAQEALTERVPPTAPPPGMHQHGPDAPPLAESAPAEAVAEDEDAFFLTNRVPLAPGGSVRVSFSITNDSLVEPKRVSLRVDALVGEHEGVPIDGSALAVRPARKTIAPADFEKFVLTGTLPAALPPDVYRGSVIVASTDEMSIPVRLLVSVP
jgi:hypothetical protein